MQKILPILFALVATTVAIGVLVIITRTGATWPRSIRAGDWRRLTGKAPVEEPALSENPVE